jgi:NDP-mannose synthase
MTDDQSAACFETAVILAGGLGMRLRPLTNLVPKPLLPMGESTVLETQLSVLAGFGVKHAYLATYYLSEQIEAIAAAHRDDGLQVTVSREDKQLGTCGPLTLLRDTLSDPFLVMNGDILTNVDFTRLHQFAVQSDADLVVTTKEIQIPFRFGAITANGDFITAIEEKPTYKQEIVAGIYAFRRRVLQVIPDNTYFGMDDLIKLLLASGAPVARYLIEDYWVDIGQLSDYEMAKQLQMQQRVASPEQAGPG